IINGGSTLTVADSTFLVNQAIGGKGGNGGLDGNGAVGGIGSGGAISSNRPPLAIVGITIRSTLHVSDSRFEDNEAIGGAGGNGSDGQGGGVFNSGPSPDGTPSLTLRSSKIVDNEASGGAAGIGGRDGQGVGGGVYNAGGTVRVHQTIIKDNHASTSDD